MYKLCIALAFDPNTIEYGVRDRCDNLKRINSPSEGLNVQIEPLRINESDLNTKRMLDLMAPGRLTIVDLLYPCITSEGACSLFNICLSIFLEQSLNVGRVIVLDEAHKYMNTSAEASTLTNTLLSIVRL
ncbi:hypothetical protein SS1G_08967 [Sclerotinia sclerotiorum 1980 UF-70]|uniref:Zona occludens toxin N-terminal domain-containing protein n=1 Tax=Sclerotinia sclerotiorum (strain ATCC 18683 / 1980 / Ss-1) TaxID=665079 RepID=A7EUG0_SCLS1|nr:hypothetical protein SS1G_08967 [Sclerotinia sclerotiorum 1980 UF-70]EDN93102.1 hypothetical protein SS1G_08967 [Sclerotinia sclerotiorum 1980 UF-70]